MKKDLQERFESLDNNYLGLKPRDGAAYYLIAYIFMWLAQIVVILIVTMAAADPDSQETLSLGNMIASAVTPFVFALTPMMYCKIANKPYLSALGLKRKPNLKQTGLALAIVVLCLIAFAPIASAFLKLIELIGYDTNVTVPLERGVGNYFLQIFLLAVLPAIGEEILFRGFVARSFKAKSYMFAVILSGVFFAIFHGNAVQLVYQAVLGMVLAYVYFASGSIFLPVMMHFVNNFISVSLTHIEYLASPVGNLTAAAPLAAIIGIYAAMVIIGGILLYIALRAFLRESKKRQAITVNKISLTDWARDFGRAFYPKGIKANWSALNSSLMKCFNDPTDEFNNVQAPINEHLDVGDLELRKKLIELDKDTARKAKIRDRNVVVLAGALVGAVWVFEFVRNILTGRGIIG